MGNKRFSPSALAADLAHLAVTNIGAAGTLIVRNAVRAGDVRAEILRRLPFESEVMVCSADEVARLVEKPPGRAPDGARWFVSVLAAPPDKVPRLPIVEPPGGAWEVRVVRVVGRYAISLRRTGGTYPNEVVEKQLGVLATTRGWDTIAQVRDRLRSGA